LWNGSATNVVYLDALDCHEITDAPVFLANVMLIRISGMRDDGGREMMYDSVSPLKLDTNDPDWPTGVRCCTHAGYNGWTRKTLAEASVTANNAMRTDGARVWQGGLPWWLSRQFRPDTPLSAVVLPTDRATTGTALLFRPCASLKHRTLACDTLLLHPGEGVALIAMEASCSDWGTFSNNVPSGEINLALGNLRVHAKVTVKDYPGPHVASGPLLNSTPYLRSGGVRQVG
jgi:hypothetical protein